MQLITLNIWGGHVRAPLLDFISSHREVDIFCLQEVYYKGDEKVSDDDREVFLDIFSELHALLPDHTAFFSPAVKGIYGIGMFIKKGIEILDQGVTPIYENPEYTGSGPSHSRELQWVTCNHKDQIQTILNVHGLWNGQGKTDSPDRLTQSQLMREFMEKIDHPKILCGDFNLRPDTESIRILERGMENLIRRYDIYSTRTSFYPKEERFADYVFTSPEIKIHQFEVMKHEVSDHAPLFLEFSV